MDLIEQLLTLAYAAPARLGVGGGGGGFRGITPVPSYRLDVFSMWENYQLKVWIFVFYQVTNAKKLMDWFF